MSHTPQGMCNNCINLCVVWYISAWICVDRNTTHPRNTSFVQWYRISLAFELLCFSSKNKPGHKESNVKDLNMKQIMNGLCQVLFQLLDHYKIKYDAISLDILTCVIKNVPTFHLCESLHGQRCLGNFTH